LSCNQQDSRGTNNKNSSSSYQNESSNEDESEYTDGTWCADVEYYNPNTGTRHTYNLDVEVQDGELVEISWPNGGWLDESHFTAEDITSGECSFTSDKGYEYTITLTSKGSCGYTNGNSMQNDIKRDIRKITCPRCSGEKRKYDDLCDDCQSAAETCPKCYGYKMEWDKICESCKDEMEEEKEDDY